MPPPPPPEQGKQISTQEIASMDFTSKCTSAAAAPFQTPKVTRTKNFTDYKAGWKFQFVVNDFSRSFL
jgi:hypothetical protein